MDKTWWSEKLSPVPLPCCESRIVLRPHSSCLLTAVYSCAVLTKRVIWSLTKNLTLKFPIVEISNSPKKAWQPSFKKSKSGIQVLDNSNNRENCLHIFLSSPQRLLAAHLPAKALLSAQVCYRKVANLWCGLKVFQCEGHLSSLWKTLRIGCKNATAQIFLPPLLLGDLAHKPGGQQLRVASWGSRRSSIVSWIGRFPRLKKQVGLANLNLETIQSTGCLTTQGKMTNHFFVIDHQSSSIWPWYLGRIAMIQGGLSFEILRSQMSKLVTVRFAWIWSTPKNGWEFPEMGNIGKGLSW